MAWFHKSLQDMKRAIEREDWDEVSKILHQHCRRLDKEVKGEVKHDIMDISFEIRQYSEDLNQISILLSAQLKGDTQAKFYMKLKVDSAIWQAKKFEEVIKDLIKEKKFMD